MIPPLKAHPGLPLKRAGLGLGLRASVPFPSRHPLLAQAVPKPTAGSGSASPVLPKGTPTSPSEGRRSIVDEPPVDPLDPLERRRAFDVGFFPATPSMAAAPVAIEVIPAEASHRAAPSLEVLLPALVRRIAWSGDGRRGSVRMELGAGPLAGGVLLVQADGLNVSVHLDAPAGADKAEWQARISRALEARGLHATVEVD